MTPSYVTKLAELLDSLNDKNLALLRETRSNITVADLDMSNTHSIVKLCDELDWGFEIFDNADNYWNADQLDKNLQPFRLEITKPECDDKLKLLTNYGFHKWLDAEEIPTICYVGRLEEEIKTLGTMYLPWNHEGISFQEATKLKSPAELVRVFASNVNIPSDIRSWIMTDQGQPDLSNTSTDIWASQAIKKLSLSLVDEIKGEEKSLIFYGPPKSSFLNPFNTDHQLLTAIGDEAFFKLHSAVRWIYELPRETEMRHHMFAAEFSRSSKGESDFLVCLRETVEYALDSARIAYQLGISEHTQETVKTLGDLRKSVLDETHKLTDITRSLATTTLGAVAIGVALIALRQASLADDTLIKTLVIAVTVHVAITIFSGSRFIHLQKELHASWRPHLYNFLPKKDFENLVVKPYRKMRKTYIGVVLGSVIVMSGLNFATFDTDYAGRAIISILEFLVSCLRMAISLVF